MEQTDNFTYKDEGHQQPGRSTSNLYINFVAVPPNPSSNDFGVTCRYTRKGSNLFFKKRITLQEALSCAPVKIPMLDGRIKHLGLDQVITPDTIKKIEGEGMPIWDKKDYLCKNQKKGDLYVSFEITFPGQINTDQKERIEKIMC